MALLHPDEMESQLATLTEEGLAALKVVWIHGSVGGITVELTQQILHLLLNRRRKAVMGALELLESLGAISTRTQNYRQIYQIAQPWQDPVDRFLAATIFAAIQPPAASVSSLPSGRFLLEDLQQLLSWVHFTKPALTQQGQLHKRHLTALLTMMGCAANPDELPGRYPEPIGLLMAFLLHRRLVNRTERQMLTGPDLTEWLALPDYAQRAELFQYWVDRYSYQDLQTIVAVLRHLPAGEIPWLDLDSATTELEPLVNPSQRGSFRLRLEHHLATFLAPLGLFELAAGSEPGQLWFRPTPAGLALIREGRPDPAAEPPFPGFWVQSTYEILAPRPVPTGLLWLLESMADRKAETDRSLTYGLNRQSVYRSLKDGQSGPALVEFLQRHSAAPVPQNVLFDLQGWTQAFGQVSLERLTLLRCSSPDLALQIKFSRRTAPFVLGELTPQDLVVDGNQEAALLEALEADGLMPQQKGGGH
ncbi:MAG TPA: helicase-associated domain-containing protein [Symbiobacteriaceae bacterium]|nr:helicase-associated domain-containing protein [Symbiobacteriaceae bacterium]